MYHHRIRLATVAAILFNPLQAYMSNSDQIQRFIFDDTRVRGVLIGLEDSYQQVLSRHEYPIEVAALLGQMLAAVGLLGSTLKFKGRLSLQARGDGPVTLLMAESNQRRDMRAIARWQESTAGIEGLDKMLGQGQLAITIEPERGNRYQGIVPLQRHSLAACLEDYFRQSEQLDTQIILAADAERASGMLLQVLPGGSVEVEQAQFEEDWQRITHLGRTLSSQELLLLDNEELLHRLFHEEKVRLFDPDDVRFACDCSRERSLQILKTLQREEIEDMLERDSGIVMDCQFCNSRYRFDRTSIAEILGESGAVAPSSEQH